MRRLFSRALLVLLVPLAASGCWYRPAGTTGKLDPSRTGEMVVAATSVGHIVPDGVLEITLQRDRLVLERTLPVQNGEARGTLEGIYEGKWQVLLSVRDADGYVTHRGSAQVEVVADGPPAQLAVELFPLPGDVSLVADLEGFSGLHQVQRARLVAHPGNERFEALREENANHIAWQVQLQPGTHDLRVELYGESFHHYRLVYAGNWFAVDVRPGRPLELVWRPTAGEVEFVGIFHGPPPPPEHVSARLDGREVVVKWDSEAGAGDEAVIFWSTSPSEHPVEVARIPLGGSGSGDPGTRQSYRHDPAAAGLGERTRLTYWVAHVNRHGQMSFRVAAPPLWWSP